jgi:hypothetical protein
MSTDENPFSHRRRKTPEPARRSVSIWRILALAAGLALIIYFMRHR